MTHYTPTQLLDFLTENNIACETREHEAVFTVEESKALMDTFPPGTPGGPGEGHVKNLFLKNKKGNMWLLTMPEDKRLDIKALGQSLGSQRLSFASAERLMENLGVSPGSVTPLALINDPEHKVEFLIDEDLLTCQHVHIHPLTNTMTSMMPTNELKKFLALLKREIKPINIC